MALKDLDSLLIINFISSLKLFVIFQYSRTVAFDVKDPQFPFIFHIYYETKILEETPKAKNLEDRFES